MSEEMTLFAKTEETDYVEADVQDSSSEKYLLFLSNGICYGVNADIVKEIITEITITHLPMLPKHLSGVYNLRGLIIPIVDFRLLLDQEPSQEHCTVVLDIEGTQIGVLADSVDRMVDIEKDSIVPVPHQGHVDGQKLISGMCSLPGDSGTMMIVDFSLLLHEQ